MDASEEGRVVVETVSEGGTVDPRRRLFPGVAPKFVSFCGSHFFIVCMCVLCVVCAHFPSRSQTNGARNRRGGGGGEARK